jgi:hypothetical protein
LELPGCFAGSGASGSVFASCTRFVIGLAAATIGLSTDFFGLAFDAEATVTFAGFTGLDWAAARPGLSADWI